MGVDYKCARADNKALRSIRVDVFLGLLAQLVRIFGFGQFEPPLVLEENYSLAECVAIIVVLGYGELFELRDEGGRPAGDLPGILGGLGDPQQLQL